MSRPLRPAVLLLAVLLAAPPFVAAQTKAGSPKPVKDATPPPIPPPAPEKSLDGVKDIPWEDTGYERYFRYQKYLTAIGLTGETKDTWAKLKPEERVAKVKKGLEFLTDYLQAMLTNPHPSPENVGTVRAVWGDAAAAGMIKVATARRSGDPEQVELALKSVKAVTGKAAEKVDWNNLFDGVKPEAEGPTPASQVDPLAPKKQTAFLPSLSSPEVTQPLSSRKTFQSFLQKHNVTPLAIPPLLAMYDVHTKAAPDEKKELGHILPTVVRFLQDGKPIVLENMPGALGFAVPGDYDTADKVAVTPAVANADPLVVADVLTHEFQHVYDMYTGRYYSLDSEMRGFKSNVMFYKAVKTISPAKVAEMENSDNEATRRYARNWKDLEATHSHGPGEFCDKIAFGHGYNNFHGATFSGRLPLRQAVDERFGLPSQLAASRKLRDKAAEGIKLLEARQIEVRKKNADHPSRELDKELEKVTDDLAAARAAFGHYDKEVTLQEIRLNRIKSEVAWLDKKSAGKKDADPYDLNLQVDPSYIAP